MENRASRQGVVRAIAVLDYCRSRLNAEMGAHFLEGHLDAPTPLRSTPRSVRARGSDPCRAGPGAGSVPRDRGPARERIGTTGKPPCRHTAVSQAISMMRSPAPCQPGTTTAC